MSARSASPSRVSGARLVDTPAIGPALTGTDTHHLDRLVDSAAFVAGNLGRAVDLARQLGAATPLPGGGRTRQRWEILASIAVGDLSAARIAEAHLDALAILAEAGLSVEPGDGHVEPDTWGVYAAEAPGVSLQAVEGADGSWMLRGIKPWCSGATVLDRALVTAHTPGGRRLFSVGLRAVEVTPQEGGWHSRGLSEVISGPVEFASALAIPVGEAGWYLRRPGFAWGGIGVAACWYGGALAVARRVWAHALGREPDQIGLLHLGEIDRALRASRQSLASAADSVDQGNVDDPALLALRVRGTVAQAVDTVLQHAGHAMGPAPLTAEEDHARRVADLQVYVRQHHAERDTARVGESLVAAPGVPW